MAPQDNVVSNEAQASVPTPVAFDERRELEQVNVLYSFLENRYTKKVRAEPIRSLSIGWVLKLTVPVSIRSLRG